jgi:hypothetical protein
MPTWKLKVLSLFFLHSYTLVKFLQQLFDTTVDKTIMIRTIYPCDSYRSTVVGSYIQQVLLILNQYALFYSTVNTHLTVKSLGKN